MTSEMLNQVQHDGPSVTVLVPESQYFWWKRKYSKPDVPKGSFL